MVIMMITMKNIMIARWKKAREKNIYCLAHVVTLFFLENFIKSFCLITLLIHLLITNQCLV